MNKSYYYLVKTDLFLKFRQIKSGRSPKSLHPTPAAPVPPLPPDPHPRRHHLQPALQALRHHQAQPHPDHISGFGRHLLVNLLLRAVFVGVLRDDDQGIAVQEEEQEEDGGADGGQRQDAGRHHHGAIQTTG